MILNYISNADITVNSAVFSVSLNNNSKKLIIIIIIIVIIIIIQNKTKTNIPVFATIVSLSVKKSS